MPRSSRINPFSAAAFPGLVFALVFQLCAPGAQASPEWVGLIDHVPGRDVQDSRLLIRDPASGALFAGGYNENFAVLKQIDPTRGVVIRDVTAPEDIISQTQFIAGAAVHPGSGLLYVAAINDALRAPEISVYRIADGTLVSTISPAGVNGFITGVALNASANRLYVAFSGINLEGAPSKVLVVDTVANSVVGTIEVGAGPAGIAVNEVSNKIYVLEQGGTRAAQSSYRVSVIDGRTQAVTGIEIPVPSQRRLFKEGDDAHRVAVNPVTNRVYVSFSGFLENGSQAFDQVAVLDGASDTLLTLVDVGSGSTDFPEFVNALAVDPVANQVLVSGRGGQPIRVLDGASNTVIGLIPLGDGSPEAPGRDDLGLSQTDLALDSAAQRLYVLAGDVVQVVDTAARRRLDDQTVVLISRPISTLGGSALNPVTNKLYTFNEQTGTLLVTSGATRAAIGSVALSGEARFAVGTVTVNATTNRIYATTPADGLLHVIDGNTDREIAVVPVLVASGPTLRATHRPRELAVDAGRNLIYVAQDGFLSVVDGATNRVDENAIAVGPRGNLATALAVDPATNRVYLGSVQPQPTPATRILVIDPTAKTIVSTLAVSGLGDIAINAATNRLYAAGTTPTAPSSPDEGAAAVYVFNTTTNVLLTVIQLLPEGSDSVPPLGNLRLAVNSTRNRIYVAGTNNSFPADAFLGTIDGATNQLTINYRNGQKNLVSANFDETRQLLYVTALASSEANFGGGETEVFFDGPSAGQFEFTAAEFLARESPFSPAAATIRVRRSQGNAGPASVKYTTSNGTALAGSDYAASSGTLYWQAEEGGERSFTVAVLDDPFVENVEGFFVTLSDPLGGATLGPRTQTQVLINSDDLAPPQGAPVVTSVLSANGRVGRAFTYRVTATKSPTSYAASGLPAGLRIKPNTGAIVGTPTQTGTFEVAISATNARGTGIAELHLRVVPAPQADLTGGISDLRFIPQADGSVLLKFVATLTNVGTKTAVGFRLKPYLSADALLDPATDPAFTSVLPLPQVPAAFTGQMIAELRPHVSIGPVAFKIRIPAALVPQLSGQYLIFAIDRGNAVDELDETNNTILVGPFAF